MKIINQLQKSIYGLNKKKIFLLGFYISFLLVMTLAMVLDIIIKNYIDVYVELFFILLTLASVLYYKQSKNTNIALYSIVIIATLTTYALLVSNHFNISIFHSIVPLGYFLLFSLKRSLIYTFIHQIIVISIYSYGYFAYPNNTVLNDPTIIVAIAMASLMIIFFGIVYHLSVENSYQLLANSNRQKEMLLKEVHHRVKNNLNIVSSMLGLQMLREEDEYIKQIFKKNKFRIKSIALIHEILYKHSDFEKINLLEYLGQLSFSLFGIFDKEVKVYIETDKNLFLPFELALKIGIISNELMANSMKYAFTEEKAEVWIDFQEDDKNYIYKYNDSSTIPINISNLKKGKSLGLKLVDMMVEQMDAELTTTNTSGLNYIITVPKNET